MPPAGCPALLVLSWAANARSACPDAVISELKGREGNGVIAFPEKPQPALFRTNERLQVRTGPLRGCFGLFVDNALQNAAQIAREIVSFRHPRISAVADPNADLLRGDMTADEMREIIRRKLVDEGLLPPPVEHPEL
jgi:hypothetical protein